VSDEFTVPLCCGHHRAAHRSGDEAAWWRQIGIDPIKTARKLWRRTRLIDAPHRRNRRSNTPAGLSGNSVIGVAAPSAPPTNGSIEEVI
jgi:hypothetical protein